MQLFPCSFDNTFIVLAFKIALILTIYGHVGGKFAMSSVESSLVSIHFEAHAPSTFFFSCDKILFVSCEILGTPWHFFYKNMAGLLAKSKTDKSDDCSLESKKPDLNVLQEAKQTEFLRIQATIMWSAASKFYLLMMQTYQK